MNKPESPQIEEGVIDFEVAKMMGYLTINPGAVEKLPDGKYKIVDQNLPLDRSYDMVE